MAKRSSDGCFDIAVLAGGCSSEREVSLASGRAVAVALAAAGDNVAVFDPAEVDLATVTTLPIIERLIRVPIPGRTAHVRSDDGQP